MCLCGTIAAVLLGVPSASQACAARRVGDDLDASCARLESNTMQYNACRYIKDVHGVAESSCSWSSISENATPLEGSVLGRGEVVVGLGVGGM